MEQYKELKDIKLKIEDGFLTYFYEVFSITKSSITSDNGIRFKMNSINNKKSTVRVEQKISGWEEEIKKYRSEVAPMFALHNFDEDDEDCYEYEDVKDELLAKKLWTVSSALKSRDKALERYKNAYWGTTPRELFNTTKHILLETNSYMNNIASGIKFNTITKVEQLKYDFLEKENMMLTGVIGLGIRSEILHRIYPSHFPIMTRKSLWAMYYLTGEEDEFVTDETYDGMHRTEHNWNYDYARFAFYINFVYKQIETLLKEYNITLKSELRFGYVNMFLNSISELNSNKIGFLTEWKTVEV